MKLIWRWVIGIFVSVVGLLGISWALSMPPKDTRGTWKTEGYGLALDVGTTTIDVYQVSDIHCMHDQVIPAHMWLVNFLEGAQFVTEGDRLRITSSGTLNPIYADRTDALPASCGTHTPTDAQTVFDVLWEVMDTHYAHFDTHGVDWEARKALRPNEAINDAALFTVLQETLAGLDDGHTYIAANDDVWSPSIPPIWHEDRYAMIDATFAAVPDLSERDEHGLQVGWAAPGIGYILMAHMEAASGLGQRPTDVAKAAFAQVVDYFADADGVIIDVRYNPGGSDDVSLAYAGSLTPNAVPAFTKTTRTETGYTEPFTAMIPPQDAQLTSPVVLLTGPYTGSAAEIFTMALRELPQVTTMGERTSGGLSDILSYTLPNGWELGLSHQIYLTMAGESFERVGIPPDVPAPVDIAAAKDGADTQLAAAVTFLQERQ